MDAEAGELTLVARKMNEPMTSSLAKLASLQSPGNEIPLNFDGPYGVVANLLNLAGIDFDRVLVAAYIGATFNIPLYQHVISGNRLAQVEFIWAIRDADEATWPIVPTVNSIYDDDKIRLFVPENEVVSTGVVAGSSQVFDNIELNRLGKTKRVL